MSNNEIIRAWKDEEYRNSLSEAQRSQLPENPAGMIELSDSAAQTFAGGRFTDRLRRVLKAVTGGVGCSILDICE